MAVLLALEMNPSIKVLHYLAFPVSIIEAHRNYSTNFLLENFISLRAKGKNVLGKEEHRVLVPGCPPFIFWRCLKFCISPYYFGKNVKKHIIQSLEKGRYVYLCVNEQYIQHRNAYNNYYHYHEILIYGYRADIDAFQTIAYNDKKRYEPQDVKSNDLIRAYKTNRLYVFTFFTICVNERYSFDKYRPNLVKRKIRQYLYTKRKAHGFLAYIATKQQIEKDFQLTGTFDLRCFRTILDRSELLKFLPEYLGCEDKIFQDAITQNIQRANSLQLLSTKYLLTNNATIVSSLLKGLDEYAFHEKKILEYALKLLQ